MKTFKLSPSSFSFLYEGCKHCFYLNVVHNIKQPSMPLPGVFSIMASLQKNHYDGMRTELIHPGIPSGLVSHGEKFVKSKIIKSSRYDSSCYISGRFDIAATFDNGSYGVIDFKTGNPKEESNQLYKRQLSAYAFALENPELGALNMSPVSKIGLIYFPPLKTIHRANDKMLYETGIHWYELEYNDKDFLRFIDEVLNILDKPTPPNPSPDCLWCNYVNQIKTIKK